MKKYERYKDSGVQWLGSVPEHWEVMPMKRLFSFCKGLTITKADLTEVGHPVISYGQIHSKQNTGVHTDECLLRFVPEKIIKDNDNCKVYPGDFIFADTSEDLDGCGNCAYIDREGIYAGYHSLVVRPFDNTISKYWAYLFQSALWRSQIRSNVYGIKVFSITQTILKEVAVLVPSVDNAAKIVSYLDSQVSKINAVITEKEKMISDMEKYRSSLISETVTKGLNPDAPMKDSGIDWIGEIPEHWSIQRLKHFTTKIGSGVTPSGGASVYTDSGVMFLRSQNIYQSGLILDDVAYISDEIDEKMAGTRVLKDDVLLNITGASIGRCHIFDLSETRANVNQHVCIIRPIHSLIKSKYLQYLLNSELGQIQIKLYQTGGNREGLNFEQIKNFSIPSLSLIEQEQIVSFLDKQTSKIDTLISEQKSQIEDLKSYKQSLITEAVTGQVDVRDWTSNE